MNNRQAVNMIITAFDQMERKFMQQNGRFADGEQRYFNAHGIRQIKEALPTPGIELFFDAYLYAWRFRN